MTFLRRGHVTFPHRLSAGIEVHKIDGIPVKCPLKAISCYEEHETDDGTKRTVIYFITGSNVVVRQSFDAVAAACDKLEVRNV